MTRYEQPNRYKRPHAVERWAERHAGCHDAPLPGDGELAAAELVEVEEHNRQAIWRLPGQPTRLLVADPTGLVLTFLPLGSKKPRGRR